MLFGDSADNDAGSLTYNHLLDRMSIRAGGSSVLSVESTGIDVTGTVTATGGNSTEWNTAYGWGDHASAGYYPASNPNGYTNDQTAAEILTAIKTVDGSGSGLDADTVDGHHAYESQILDTRDSGDVTPDGFEDKRVSYSFTDEIAGSTHVWDSVITVKGWSDNYRAWQITSNSSLDDTDRIFILGQEGELLGEV